MYRIRQRSGFEALSIEREKLVDRVKELGPYFAEALASLRDHPIVGETRSLGLIGAIELSNDKKKRGRFKDSGRTAAGQRPSMGQDMQKGRRTEIEFLNGMVAREGERLGVPCKANATLTDIVKRVERGEIKPDPKHIT